MTAAEALRLVPASEAHAEVWHRWRRDETVRRHVPMLDSGIDELRARLSGTGAFGDERRWFAVREEEPVATVSVKVNPLMRHGELGYMVAPGLQGRGIGAACVRLAVETAFATLEVDRLFALVSPENAASWRLLKRLGFKREGTLREHYLIRGVPTDQHVYGLLRSEWPTK